MFCTFSSNLLHFNVATLTVKSNMLFCPFGVIKGCLQIHDYSKRFLDQAVKSTGAKALIKLATLLWQRGDGHAYIPVLEVVTNCKMFNFWSAYFSQKETLWRACLRYSVYLYLYTYGLTIILILLCLSIMALRIFICSLILNLPSSAKISLRKEGS